MWSYCGAFKKVQDEGDGTAVDADEEVDTWQRDVGCAGNTEYKGHGVHHGYHRPAKREKEKREIKKASVKHKECHNLKTETCDSLRDIQWYTRQTLSFCKPAVDEFACAV